MAGPDLLTKLKMVLDFEKRTLRWGDSEVEMKERGAVTDTNALQLLYEMIQESPVSKAAEEQQAKILDADYSKIEMSEHVKSLGHLNADQKSELLQALKNYPTLFGGGLGKLNIEPIRLELKEGAKPYNTKPFNTACV